LPTDLDVKITKDGELQAANNIDIISTVEGQATITQIIKEGTYVLKGQVLVTLDSSLIKQKIEDTTLDVQRAEADLTTAKEMKEIQASQNATNLEAARVAVDLATLDLQQYTEGLYPQQVKNAETDLAMAQLTLKNAEETLAQTRSLAAKGYVTPMNVKTDELAEKTARNTLEKADTALHVLTTYTHQMDLSEKKNTLLQAEQKLIRTGKENTSSLAQKIADLQAKEQALVVKRRLLARLQEQFDACIIEAPADGLAVYASERWSDTRIQEGTQVRERQQLLRLPDTSSMKAVVRIQEAQVPRLKLGQRASVKVVGVAKPLSATLTKISVLADSGQRFWNPDLKEYPVELTLEDTPTNLKPGIGVLAEIYVDRLSEVLAAPLSAIYTAGKDSYVFVKDAQGTKPVKVKLGDSNETSAQILSGIEPGAQVLVLQVGQGRELLDQAGIKVEPTTKPADFKNEGGKRRTAKADSVTPKTAEAAAQ